MIKPFKGVFPTIDPLTYIEESASVIGDVHIGGESGVWFNCVIRGDVNSIRIGKRTNIQDGSVLHVDHNKFSLTIGDDVTVGHGVILHGCKIESNVLIGMGSIVMGGATIGKNVIIGAGSLVTQNTTIPDGVLALGRPAKVKRALTLDEIKTIAQSASDYVTYFKEYLEPYHPG